MRNAGVQLELRQVEWVTCLPIFPCPPKTPQPISSNCILQYIHSGAGNSIGSDRNPRNEELYKKSASPLSMIANSARMENVTTFWMLLNTDKAPTCYRIALSSLQDTAPNTSIPGRTDLEDFKSFLDPRCGFSP